MQTHNHLNFNDLISKLNMTSDRCSIALEHFNKGLNDPLFFSKIQKAKKDYQNASHKIIQQNNEKNFQVNSFYQYLLFNKNSELHQKWQEEYITNIEHLKKLHFKFVLKKILSNLFIFISSVLLFLSAYVPYSEFLHNINEYLLYAHIIISFFIFTFAMYFFKTQNLDQIMALNYVDKELSYNYTEFIDIKKIYEKRELMNNWKSEIINYDQKILEKNILKEFFNYKPMTITYLFLKYKTNDLQYNTQLAFDLFKLFKSELISLNNSDISKFDSTLHRDTYLFQNI